MVAYRFGRELSSLKLSRGIFNFIRQIKVVCLCKLSRIQSRGNTHGSRLGDTIHRLSHSVEL